ncbi:LysR family transcriptional regulator [Zobellella sp. DQSA1]|uniref:LysR family transcriptional regulator n=1 Tax=Zobellella sp. DQSA1 TaxID=3342386 RepID=UPI0035BFCEC3
MDRLEAVRSFVEVAGSGSFTQAAERLGLTRVRVSRHITEVEAWLQARLLHRTTRRVSLTEAGLAALPLCEQLLSQVGELENRTRPRGEALGGSIRVASPIGLGQHQLYELVEDFLALHPGVQIQLLLSDRNARLVDERVDVALRFSRQPDPQLIARRLMRVDSCLCAAPGYLARAGRPEHPHDLAGHNCLVHLDGIRWGFNHGDAPLVVEVRGNFGADDMGVLARAAARGQGIALLPCDLANPYLQRGELVPLLADYQAPSSWVWAVYLSRSYQQPLVRTFIDFVAERWQQPVMMSSE